MDANQVGLDPLDRLHAASECGFVCQVCCALKPVQRGLDRGGRQQRQAVRTRGISPSSRPGSAALAGVCSLSWTVFHSHLFRRIASVAIPGANPW